MLVFGLDLARQCWFQILEFISYRDADLQSPAGAKDLPKKKKKTMCFEPCYQFNLSPASI
jgi:hypothetical protein